MQKLIMMSITPLHAGTMDEIGDTIDDLTSDLQFGAGIGISNTNNLSNTFLFYGIAEKELDIDTGDIASAAQVRIGTGSGSLNFLISGLYKGSMEIEDFNVYGLAGLTYSSSASVTSGGITTNTSSTSTDFTWGLGAEYDLEPDLKVAAEYQKINTTSVFSANAYLEF